MMLCFPIKWIDLINAMEDYLIPKHLWCFNSGLDVKNSRLIVSSFLLSQVVAKYRPEYVFN